jgi:hypothetical protein
MSVEFWRMALVAATLVAVVVVGAVVWLVVAWLARIGDRRATRRKRDRE